MRGLTVLLASSMALSVVGCMVPLPPHGKSASTNTVATRLSSDGRRIESVEQKEWHRLGRWLIHPNGCFSEWEGARHCTYTLIEHSTNERTELKFLEYVGQDPWHFIEIPDASKWLAWLPPSGSSNDNTVVVFDSDGSLSRRIVPTEGAYCIENGGRVVRFQSKSGWRIYRVLEDEIVPAEPHPRSR